MSLFRALPRGVPDCVSGAAYLDHILYALGKIWPLFNDGAPGGPDGRRSAPVQGEGVVKSLQILLVELGVVGQLHIIRIGSTLGVDVEHQKAVEAVVQGDTLHRLQSVVQIVRGRGGGIDPDADQGVFSPGAQDISVFRVNIWDVEPAFRVIVR